MSQTELFTNNALATLSSALSNSATTIVLTTGQGAYFPTPSSPQYFWVSLVNGTNIEICKCTNNSGDVLTVVRGQQGTTPQAFATNGTTVELRLTASSLTAFAQLTGDTFTGPVVAPSITLTNQLSPWTFPVTKNANYTANNLDFILADTSTTAWTLTLPASPAAGYMVLVSDLYSKFATNNLTISGNSNNIIGNSGNLIMDTNGASAWFYFTGTTQGWILIQL